MIDPRFFDLFCGAVDIALDYVRQAETGKTQIGNHKNWPKLFYHKESGLPWVQTDPEGPKNYGDAIQGIYSTLFGVDTGEPPLDFRKEKSVIALVDYAKAQLRLKQFLILERPNLGTSHLVGLVANALDRYIHTTNTTELDRTKLLPIYLPLERYLFSETLPVVVVVPILFLKFEFQQLQISKFISVEKLSNEFHLARGWRGPFTGSDNSLVESAATHGLFIRGQGIQNENWLEVGHLEMESESYPVEDVDTFFAALRIATGYATGYAQMLMLPVKWASSYAANINPIDGPDVEKYPPFFKHGYWLEHVPTVTSHQADETKGLFSGLQQVLETNHVHKVRLAMHRLNLSATRSADEDGIIDSIVAMEALLSDGVQEMTHKIAMRLAALYKILDRSRTVQAFMEMKHIYRFRSKVVHGSADLDKDREISRNEGKIAASDAAFEHLRNVFAVLIKNPALLEPKKIDRFLLTDAF